MSQGIGNEQRSPPSRTVVETLLIVPPVHGRVFERHLQATMYEAFHRDWRCNLVHRICTTAALLALMVIAARAWPGPLGGAWAVAAVVTFWSFVLAPAATIVVLPVVVGLALTAEAVSASASSAMAAAGSLAGAVLLQTMSHVFEPVPPPLSGSDGFIDFRTYARRAGWRGVARGLVLVVFVYSLLELWAVPRVFALQCQELLFWLGRRPTEAARLRAEADRFITAPGPWLRALDEDTPLNRRRPRSPAGPTPRGHDDRAKTKTT